MKLFLFIFAGGGLGAVLRYYISLAVQKAWGGLWPLGTACVNGTGCFLIGFLAVLMSEKVVPPGLKLCILTGFLGAFTTFSTFSLETLNLLKAGEYGLCGLNVLVNNGAGLLLVYAGTLAANLALKWL